MLDARCSIHQHLTSDVQHPASRYRRPHPRWHAQQGARQRRRFCLRHAVAHRLAGESRAHVCLLHGPTARHECRRHCRARHRLQEPHRREQLLSNAAQRPRAAQRAGLEHWQLRKPNHSAHHRRRQTHDGVRRIAARSRLLRPRHSPAVRARRRIAASLSLCYHHTPEIIDALMQHLARLR